MWKMDASLIKNSDGTWKPDENKLVLYSAGQIVGTLQFDMSNYRDQKPVAEKATIVAEGTGSTSLVGNAEQYPGAFIEYRVTVTEIVPKSAAVATTPKQPAALSTPEEEKSGAPATSEVDNKEK